MTQTLMGLHASDKYFVDSQRYDMYVMRVLLAAILICASFTAKAEVLNGRAFSISDGDTFRLVTADGKRTRVRIDGIDAPERTQPYSQVSRRNLGELINGQLVTIEWHKTDKYGRPVAMCAHRTGGMSAWSS